MLRAGPQRFAQEPLLPQVPGKGDLPQNEAGTSEHAPVGSQRRHPQSSPQILWVKSERNKARPTKGAIRPVSSRQPVTSLNSYSVSVGSVNGKTIAS